MPRRLCVRRSGRLQGGLHSLRSGPSKGKPTKAIFWIAKSLAAVPFGVGHLQAMALFVPSTALPVFGWPYRTRGLESAMLAHFLADIVLHILLAL